MSSFEEILEFTEKLVHATKEEHLNDLQRIILKECWQNSKKTYDQIAVEYDYSANYIKQGVGPKLWRLLVEVTGGKVTKGNVHSVLERQIANHNSNILNKQKYEIINKNITANCLANSNKQKIYKSKLPTLESPVDNVPLNSPFYIEIIPQEAQCYAEILQEVTFIRIKAPRQMGKSSLMYRILNFAKRKNYQTTLIHFQQADSRILSDLDRFWRWFCANLAKQLNLTLELE